jgi:hypothetical protein
LKILSADRVDGADAVTLKLRIAAQVSDRNVELAAVAIAVQFFSVADAGQSPAPVPPQWLKVAAWENFTAMTFLVHHPAPPARCAGYVVRTYYRNQLQDWYAAPASLAALVPELNR